MAKAKKAAQKGPAAKKPRGTKPKAAPKRAAPKKALAKKAPAKGVHRGILSPAWPSDEPAFNTSWFLRTLPPMSDVRRPTRASLAKLGNRLPPRVIDFLQQVGFGRFGQGFI